MKSIRSIVLLCFLLVVLVQAGASVYKIFFEASRNLERFYDKQLVLVSHAVPRDVLPQRTAGRRCENEPETELAIAIWAGDSGQPVYRSCALGELIRPSAEGFGNTTIAGEGWRTYVRRVSDRTVWVARPLRVQSVALDQLSIALITQVLWLIPLFALLVWFAVNRSLKPLRRFTRELQERSPGALENIVVDNLPGELVPVAGALNDLMTRLDRALSAQQAFIADAAHEILTPLAGLRVQTQMLEKAKTEERRTQALLDVHASVERCVNLARQLLAMARSTSELPQESLRTVDLAALARHAVEEALPQAQARQIDLGVLGPQRVTVTGDELALQVLVRNLLDNAIKYSQPVGRVDVIVGDDGSPQLIVSDAGPGVSPAERARLFDRFYRGRNPDVEGTGLGLAIVKEIAERHGAQIDLKSPGTLGGLDVVVRFPRSSTAVITEDNSTAA